MPRSSLKRCPPGLVGAIFGALGALTLLPIAAALARRISSLPTLPGAERVAGDFKQATYAEAAVLLLVVPLAALLFGSVLPRLLESRAGAGSLSFEWIAVGFGSSFVLAQVGVGPATALAAGILAAAALAAGIAAFRRSFRVRRLFGRSGRRAAAAIVVAGSSLELARRSGLAPARFALPGRVPDVVVAGLALFVLAALLCLRLSRRPSAMLSRLGDSAWLPIGAAAVSIAWPSTLPWLPLVGLAGMPVAALLVRMPARSSALRRAAVVGLFLACAWRVVHRPVFKLDVLEDGVSLFGTQLYLDGARPYVGVAPIHGWGADGGIDSFCAKLFGATLETYSLRCSIWAAGAALFLAAACVVALGPLWGGVALLLCLSVGPLTLERQMLAFAALLLLCWGARDRRPLALAAAGAVAAWEILFSLDYGLVLAAGGLGALALLPVLERRTTRRDMVLGFSGLRNFALGLVLGLVPFLLSLALVGSLTAFFHASFVEIPRWVEEAWGLPVVSLWGALSSANTAAGVMALFSGPAVPPIFLLLVLGAAGAVLLLRGANRQIDATDRAAWVALAVAAVAMRAVLGRADTFHYARYGLLVGIPAAWLLMRAWRGGRAGDLLLAPAALLILVRLHPVHTLDFELQTVENAARSAAETPGAPAPRSGRALLPPEQAAVLNWFRQFTDAHLAPEATFFDFSNEPALYFVADRIPPIRYCSVAQYESDAAQNEVIAALEKSRPPLALLPRDSLEFDGVTNAERAPQVYRYLIENYEPDPEVEGMAWRKGARRTVANP